MKILEFGDTSKRKLMLIHGFQSPWQVWNKYIERYKEDYHIIVPILSGHNPEEKDDFISFVEEAKEIEDYILSLYGKDVYAVYGMSMGGVLAATLWQNERLAFDKVIFDGSPLVSLGGFMKGFMKKFYIDITHKTKQRDKKIVEQATKSIISEDNLESFLRVLDHMSDVTIVNCLDSIAEFKLKQDIVTPNTVAYFFHGTASNEMVAKKSAKYVQRYYPNTQVMCFKGAFHCENALFHPEVMIDELDGILNSREFPFVDAPNTACFTCRHILDENKPILYVSHDDDGYWQFLCGGQHKEEDARVVSLTKILSIDETIADFAGLDYGEYVEIEEKG